MADKRFCECCDGERCCCGRESMERLRKEARQAHVDGCRAGLEEASGICSEILDAKDFGLDRERTVAEVRHRINKLRVRIGNEESPR